MNTWLGKIKRFDWMFVIMLCVCPRTHKFRSIWSIVAHRTQPLYYCSNFQPNKCHRWIMTLIGFMYFSGCFSNWMRVPLAWVSQYSALHVCLCSNICNWTVNNGLTLQHSVAAFSAIIINPWIGWSRDLSEWRITWNNSKIHKTQQNSLNVQQQQGQTGHWKDKLYFPWNNSARVQIALYRFWVIINHSIWFARTQTIWTKRI